MKEYIFIYNITCRKVFHLFTVTMYISLYSLTGDEMSFMKAPTGRNTNNTGTESYTPTNALPNTMKYKPKMFTLKTKKHSNMFRSSFRPSSGSSHVQWIKMHGETVKFVGVQQAKLYNTYKNTKLKLLETNAAIWFNKMCRNTQL